MMAARNITGFAAVLLIALAVGLGVGLAASAAMEAPRIAEHTE